MVKQREVPVERIEAEVMLLRMLRDEQIRNSHFDYVNLQVDLASHNKL